MNNRGKITILRTRMKQMTTALTYPTLTTQPRLSRWFHSHSHLDLYDEYLLNRQTMYRRNQQKKLMGL